VARLATQADFRGRPDPNTPVPAGRPTWLYDDYRRFPFFVQRAQVIRQRFPAAVTVLVAGCAHGYLVDELRKLGAVAWGCDASAWATGQAAQAVPASAQFVRQGDCLNVQSLRAVRSAAGIPQSGRFAVGVTEDLLPVAASDAEATTMLTNLRAVCTVLFHVVTPGSPADPHRMSGLLWKPIAAWRAFLPVGEAILDAETGEVV
jgi:hypothetical protein